ncbi:MAG: hypothetical protein ACLU5I_00475 [Alistipes finegoldii]
MKFSFHLLLTCIALTACGESGKTTADYRIVPRPGEIAPGDGGDFELDARTRIVCTGDGDGMRANAEFLAGYVESVVGSAPKSPVRRPLRRRQGSHPAGRRAGAKAAKRTK